MSSTEGWLDVTLVGMSVVGLDEATRPFASWWNSIFFIVFMLGGSVMGINLFIGEDR